MGDGAEKIVRKNVFAKMCGVTPARVSQWLSEGKLTGDALVGEGRTAKINVAVAIDQLKTRLDTSQRFGLNGLATRLEEPPAGAPAQLSFETAPGGDQAARSSQPDADDSFVKQIQTEKLRQAQLMTNRLEEQDRLARGIYVRAKDVDNEITKIASQVLVAMEGALNDFSIAICGKFEIPARDVLPILKKEFRALRERMAKKYTELAASLPETIEDHESYN